MNKLAWECIHFSSSEQEYTHTFRAKVFGGWIVINSLSFLGNMSESSVFVPDPIHQWEIND